MPLFRRGDGELVKGIDPVRRMMPFILRGRNQSTVYHTASWIIADARSWLRRFNQDRSEKSQATLFHLVAYATLKAFHARPGLNRFVSGGRIYQRKGVWLSFAVKRRLADEAPLATVKLDFAENQSFAEFVDRMAHAVHQVRFGPETRIEQEVRLLTKLPSALLPVILAMGRTLDRLNLLPVSLIEPDPMYTSLFLANLGSIRMNHAYHHLYEHGTCGLFCVVGGVNKMILPERGGAARVHDVLHTHWTFDERVNDGLYCTESLEIIRKIVEHPGRHIVCDEEQWLAAAGHGAV